MTVAAPPRRPPEAGELEALFAEARRRRRRRRLRVALVAVVLLAAGAGAYAALGGGSVFGLGGGSPAAAPPHYRAVVLLVDVSGSMRATDVEPTRLDATVKALQTFVATLPRRLQVGLVAFSTSAKVVVTPTTDRARVLSALRALTPLAGTALGAGLDTAVTLTMRLLRRDGIRRVPGRDVPAAIVLESDGAQNRGPITPLASARRAKAGGIRVDGIALGTARGVVRFGYGRTLNSIPVPPDPETVEQIAAVTGGNAFTARDASTLAAVYRRLGQQLAR